MVKREGEDVDVLLSKAETGDRIATKSLLRIGLALNGSRALSERIAKVVNENSTGMNRRGRFLSAQLFAQSGQMEEWVDRMWKLAFEENYPSAQWILGRAIAGGRVPGIERQVGFELLFRARENGHLRAQPAIYWCMARNSNFPTNILYGFLGYIFGVRTVFLKRVIRVNPELVS